MSGIVAELKRRNVFKVAAAYIVLAWLLVQVAETLVSMLGLSDVFGKSLFVVLVLGFPLAVFFAWAYELTPQGLKKEKDVDRDHSITHLTGRKLDFVIIAALAIAVVYFAATHEWSEKSAPASVADTGLKTIAVLPFVNMSDDEVNEYFSDGISEEILNVLVRVGGMRVTSRTSAFAFKGKDVDIPTIANQLGVEHILEGSVRRAGNRIRITAQLIDVKTDSHLWSDTYDRQFDDIFTIQSEISENIVEALQLALGTVEPSVAAAPPTENLRAYELYLRGRHLLHNRGRVGHDGLEEARQLFEEAIGLDPRFAGAYAALGAVHVLYPGYAGTDLADSAGPAESALERALELDNTIGEAHAALGLLHFNQDRWVEGEQSMSEAIRVDPSFETAYVWYGIFLTVVGKTQQAKEVLMLAADKDPTSAIGAHWLADIYRNLGEMEESRYQAARSVDLGMASSIMGVYVYHLARGDYEEAASTLEESPIFGSDPSYVGPLIDAVRDPSDIPVFLSALADVHSRNPAFYHGWLFFDFDDPEPILDVIEEYESKGNLLGVMYRAWEPKLVELRAHPRFAQMAERTGLIEYWKQTGWPDLCRQSTDTLICD